jgi:hypothetical protein
MTKFSGLAVKSEVRQRLCRHCDAWVCRDQHLIWQAARRYVKHSNALGLILHEVITQPHH